MSVCWALIAKARQSHQPHSSRALLSMRAPGNSHTSDRPLPNSSSKQASPPWCPVPIMPSLPNAQDRRTRSRSEQRKRRPAREPGLQETRLSSALEPNTLGTTVLRLAAQCAHGAFLTGGPTLQTFVPSKASRASKSALRNQLAD